MNADAEKIDPDEPWKSEDAGALDKRPVAEWVEKQEVSPLCKRGQCFFSPAASWTYAFSACGNLTHFLATGIVSFKGNRGRACRSTRVRHR